MSLYDPYWIGQMLQSNASNIVTGTNPSYTSSDFTGFYPQFSSISGTVIDQFIAMANATVIQTRWQDLWKMGMNLYVAHFCELYSQATATGAGNGQAQGLVSSKAIGDLSVGMDFGALSEDLKGWGNWTLTSYGQQYATLAQTLTMGGMLIW